MNKRYLVTINFIEQISYSIIELNISLVSILEAGQDLIVWPTVLQRSDCFGLQSFKGHKGSLASHILFMQSSYLEDCLFFLDRFLLMFLRILLLASSPSSEISFKPKPSMPHCPPT